MLSSQHDSKDLDSRGTAGGGCGSASDGCECGEAAGCGGGTASEHSGAPARSFAHGAAPEGDARAAVDERAWVHGAGPPMDFRAAVEGRALGHGAMVSGNVRAAVEGRALGHGAMVKGDVRRAVEGRAVRHGAGIQHGLVDWRLRGGTHNRVASSDGGPVDGSNWTHPGEEGSTGSYNRSSPGNRVYDWNLRMWFTQQNYYLADESFSQADLDIMDKAFDQINSNIGIVEEYFDEEGVQKSGDCVVNLLSGGDFWSGQLHFVRGDPEQTHSSDGDGDAATTRGQLYILWDKHYIRGHANSYRDVVTRGRDDGESPCLVAGLASAIVHETTHACWSDERMAYLLQEYYQREFIARHGYTNEDFCCINAREREPVTTWDPSDYTEDQAFHVGYSTSVGYDNLFDEYLAGGCYSASDAQHVGSA